MAREVRSIDVNVPIRTAYNQWTQFEEFPRFMDGVDAVEQVDDTTVRWRASIAGVQREWTSRIAEQIPDRGIIWTGFGDVDNAGTVLFEPLDDQTTRVTVALDYTPVGAAEQIADAAGIIGRRLSGDLRRFKDYIEQRGVESGAWRGEIEAGQRRAG